MVFERAMEDGWVLVQYGAQHLRDVSTTPLRASIRSHNEKECTRTAWKVPRASRFMRSRVQIILTKWLSFAIYCQMVFASAAEAEKERKRERERAKCKSREERYCEQRETGVENPR